MNSILVPTDYSEISNNALHYAADLAKATNAKLTLLHVYQVPIPSGDVPVLMISPAELEKENEKRLKSEVKRLDKAYSGKLKIEHILRVGFVTEEIHSTAAKLNPDLIIMGIKGESRLSRALIGSNTTSIIKKTNIPVLAIPHQCKFKKVENFVLAYDYKNVINDATVNRLKNFIKLFNAKLFVLDVVKPSEVPVYQNAIAGIKIENSLKEIEHSLHLPEGEDVIEEINTFAKAYKADWLVMLPQRYKFISSLFHQSNTKQMIFHTDVPLLSLHE